MTTLTHPTITFTARVESFLAATLAAVTLLVLLVWMMTGATGAMSNFDTAAPVPSAQAQSAPPRSGSTVSPTDDRGSGVLAPNPQPQVAPPRPDQQPAPTTE